MAENYSSLLEAFELLNRRKRENPEQLEEKDIAEWKRLRREIEKVLFKTTYDKTSDTREYLRVPVSLAVRYWSRNELKDRYISILGEGGVFVSTVDPLPLGTELDLEIVLARQGFSMEVKGKVVWLDEGEDPAKRGMGIAFKNLDFQQKRTIYSLVDDTLHQQLLERREHARIAASLRVEYVYAHGFIEATQTTDISLNGMHILTDQPLEVGEKIKLALQVESGQPAIQAVGKVVRVVNADKVSKKTGMGIRFIKMNSVGKAALREYLKKRVNSEQTGKEGERRRYVRVERLIKLRFQSADKCVSALACDLSKTSIFIQTHDCLPPGHTVRVTLVHPVNLKEFEIVGRVVRSSWPDPDKPTQKTGIAVVFENLADEKKELLEWFLNDALLLPKEKWRQSDETKPIVEKKTDQKKKTK